MTLPHWVQSVYEAAIVEDHFHNYEVVWGAAAAPTGTHFGDVESLNAYHAISGNNAFGAECNVIGTADTPVRAGKVFFDTRRISIKDVSNATPFIVRVIWGTPIQTAAQAELAMQRTDTVVHQPTANGQNKPQDVWNVRVPVGSQIWVKIKNATNLATMDFFMMSHEYPSTSP
jgi:hypothetical protein